MYKLINNLGKDGSTVSKSILKETDDGSKVAIPFDPDNTDYQAYLKWLAEGNTPLPAENA